MSVPLEIPPLLREAAPRDADRVRAFVAASRRGLYRNTALTFLLMIVVVGALLQTSPGGDRAAIAVALSFMGLILGAVFGGVAWRTRAVVTEVLRVGEAHPARIVARTTVGRGVARAVIEVRPAGGAALRGFFDLPVGAPGQLSVGTEGVAVVAGERLAFLAPAGLRVPVAYPGRLEG